MRSKLPRLTARLCTVALLLWPGIPPARAAKPMAAAKPVPGWQAVLVAADNAQPVFDNGVEAIAHQLAARDVPAGNIHRLSASEEPRDGAAEAFAQPSVDHGLFADQADAPAVPDGATSETT